MEVNAGIILPPNEGPQVAFGGPSAHFSIPSSSFHTAHIGSTQGGLQNKVTFADIYSETTNMGQNVAEGGNHTTNEAPSSCLRNSHNNMFSNRDELYLTDGDHDQEKEDVDSHLPSIPQELLQLLHSLPLADRERQRQIINDLSKQCHTPEEAEFVWTYPGVIGEILNHIVTAYQEINPPMLNENTVRLLCAISTIFQLLVLNRRTREPLLQAHMLDYLLPFVDNDYKTREIEYLRICVLSLFLTVAEKCGAGVLNRFFDPNHSELLRIVTDAVRHCISEVGRSLATAILYHFTLLEPVQRYLCSSFDRFKHVHYALCNIIVKLHQKQPTTNSRAADSVVCGNGSGGGGSNKFACRTLKCVILCYLQFARMPACKEALRTCLPRELFDRKLVQMDATAENLLVRLVNLIGSSEVAADGTTESVAHTVQ